MVRALLGSRPFVNVLRRRLLDLGCDRASTKLLTAAVASDAWVPLASLDAAARMVADTVKAGSVQRGREAAALLDWFLERCAADRPGSGAIPEHYWTVLDGDAPDGSLVRLSGAVVISVRRPATASGAVATPPRSREVAAVLDAPREQPLLELGRLLLAGGRAAPLAVCGALAVAASFGVVEAVVLRGVVDVAQDLGIVRERVAGAGVLIAFFAALLVLELPLAHAIRRIGRHLEARLRIAFLTKLPKLTDRYLSSRTTSDMAGRAYELASVRAFPELGAELLRASMGLVATVAAITWLHPSSAFLALLAGAAAVALPLVAQSVLNERDLRVRVHAGALGGFYLDALRGLVPIRTHGAERAVRREHEALLVQWTHASRALVAAAIDVETATSALSTAVCGGLLFQYVRSGGPLIGLLLFAYWVMSIPALGQAVGGATRRYATVRNTSLRLLEPLGAVENAHLGAPVARLERPRGMELSFAGVTVVAGGHTILDQVDLKIAPGSEVAIVGPSGAGKSTFVGLLLGWHRAAGGRVLIDGHLLDPVEEDRVRREAS